MAAGAGPRNCGCVSGNPGRPSSGAAQTGQRSVSASRTTSSHPVLAAPPTTMAGACADRSASSTSCSPAALACSAVLTERTAGTASASASKSSMGTDRNTGPAGGCSAAA